MMIQNLKINRKSNSSASKQLETFFRNKILGQELSPGDRLPTTADIVKMINVGASTVREAMARLAQDGLVEATPGKGTFVKGPEIDVEPLITRRLQNSLKKVCVLGAFNPPDEGGWYKRLMMSGIMRQCHGFGADVVTLGRDIKLEEVDNTLKTISQIGCNGIVWLLPEPNHWAIIEGIQKSNIPIVVARNSHGSDGYASIEVDYEGVGFEAGRDFIDQGCEGILLFTRQKTSLATDVALKHGSWPSNILSGFHRAFIYFKPSAINNNVKEIPLGGNYHEATSKLENVLEQHNNKNGLFFVDPMHLASFIINNEQEAIQKLKNLSITMITNNDNYGIFAPYANELNLCAFMDQPEHVGVLAIQKLMSLLEGHLANTVTSIQLMIEKYDAKKSIRRLASEAEKHRG